MVPQRRAVSSMQAASLGQGAAGWQEIVREAAVTRRPLLAHLAVRVLAAAEPMEPADLVEAEGNLTQVSMLHSADLVVKVEVREAKRQAKLSPRRQGQVVLGCRKTVVRARTRIVVPGSRFRAEHSTVTMTASGSQT